jgi:hypothetical protein
MIATTFFSHIETALVEQPIAGCISGSSAEALRRLQSYLLTQFFLISLGEARVLDPSCRSRHLAAADMARRKQGTVFILDVHQSMASCFAAAKEHLYRRAHFDLVHAPVERGTENIQSGLVLVGSNGELGTLCLT